MPRVENPKYDRSQEPIVLSKSVIDLLLDQTHGSDLIALYVFYYQTAKWQCTNQPKATTSYVATGLGWGTQKVARRKGDLIELGLIESVTVKHADTGQVLGHYIKVNFIWSVGSKPEGDFARGGESPGVVESPTNALSVSSINALSVYTPKFKKLVDLTKWFLAHQHRNFPTLVSITDDKIQKGAQTLEKLIRIDEFNLTDEIRPALKFVIKDEFWSKQVRSLVGLRHKSKSNGEMKFSNILASMDRSQSPKLVTDKTGMKVFETLTQILVKHSGLNSKALAVQSLHGAASNIRAFFDNLPEEAQDRSIYPSRVHSFVKQYGLFIEDTYANWNGLNETSLGVGSKTWNRFLVSEQKRIGIKLTVRRG